MDILKLLKSMKGKVLDDDPFDHLHEAFVMQNQQIDKLDSENKRLASRVSELESILASKGSRHDDVPLSGTAQAIIQQSIADNATAFLDEEMIATQRNSYSKMKVKAALDELEDAGLVVVVSRSSAGTEYVFTEKGKQYIVKISRQQRL